MKLLFVIQGEGRGHFTQALVMREMLSRRGDQVVAVLVGKSPARQLPDYFINKIGVPVFTFESPNFLPTAQNKRSPLLKSIASNCRHLPDFYRSMQFIRHKIRELKPDMVINFYELLTGFTYLFMPPGVPQICVGHQYMFLHRNFSFPERVSGIQLASLRFFTYLTSIGASRLLALSFYASESDPKKGISVVPPLIRKEIKNSRSESGDYLLGYLLNNGYVGEVKEWHNEHPGIPLHFFWDKKDAPVTYPVTSDFVLHRIDDSLFAEYMAGCRAYSTTAGFESVCEALYLHKPVLMIPVHIEQECNAYDACRVGAGISADKFDLDRLLHFIPEYHPDSDFRVWADLAEQKIYAELCAVYDQQWERSVFYQFYDRLYQRLSVTF